MSQSKGLTQNKKNMYMHNFKLPNSPTYLIR
jgi:hypothetical protein